MGLHTGLVILFWLSILLVVSAESIQLDLQSLFNNKGIGTRPGEASFDNGRRAYPASSFATAAPNGTWSSPTTGIVYSLPGYTGSKKSDNIVCGGQRISVPDTASAPFSLSMLIASDQTQQIVSGNLVLTYKDGHKRTVEMRASPAWSMLTQSHGDIVAPYTWTANGIDRNTSHIFEYTVGLEGASAGNTSAPALASITLPDMRQSSARIHIFAATFWTADGKSVDSRISIQNVRPTQKWNDKGHQIIEVTLNNAGTECFSSGKDAAAVLLRGGGVNTTEPGRIRRLCPGDQRRVNIGIDGEAARDANVTVVFNTSGSSGSTSSTPFPYTRPVRLGFLPYDAADQASLDRHESPEWFDGAKYGIFIHWGSYAVPGYGGPPDHETYAEWFWWYSQQRGDSADTYGYRQRTFGKNWAYDDGFANFTASAWDPKTWVDLFADAGATYFVLTSKHHDGFALFDTGTTSDRNSIKYGPKRDIIKELFDAAEKHHPSMKRGTYFSMPEWFNPDFQPYGFSSWPGQLARNPFTGAVEPYTGRRSTSTQAGAKYDYVRDLQIPQMETLAYKYGTEIMWCDCGPATNATSVFVAEWWNRARQNRTSSSSTPVVNSRCGLPQLADFETPEYATYSSAQRRKWESNRGMDPFSYGYNRATPAASYMDAASIVFSLVDIVAKNGNLLLDIGPKADGSIVDAEANNLRAAGKWIRAHGEALFNTTYWFVQTEWKTLVGDDVRFTQTDDAFYVTFLKNAPKPGSDGFVVVDVPVPVQQGDTVSLLAVEGGDNLQWERRGTGIAVKVSSALLAKDQYAWVFKIAYGGETGGAS